MLGDIVGGLDIKANAKKNSMVEEYLKNNIILYIGFSIDIFSHYKLVTYIKRSNQVIHLYGHTWSKINQNTGGGPIL